MKTSSGWFTSASGMFMLAVLALATAACKPKAPEAAPVNDTNWYGGVIEVQKVSMSIEKTTLALTDEMLQITPGVVFANNGTEPFTVKADNFQLVNANNEPLPALFKAFSTEVVVEPGKIQRAELPFRGTVKDMEGPLYLVTDGQRLRVKDEKPVPEIRMPIYNGTREFISPDFWRADAVKLPQM